MTDPAPAKRLVLVDGSGYIFRAFFALPPMTRPDGTPVNAVFGFANMLLRLLQEHSQDDIVVVFDASGTSFRNDMYADYKANRDAPPPELKPQFSLVREAARAFSLPAVEEEGYEADDLIASYARTARAAGEEVLVVSSDKDLMQLVGDGVRMWDPMKQKEIGRDEVVERFGVGPELVRDALALIGDTSDNVPGVPGIGAQDRRPAAAGARLARGPAGPRRRDQAAEAARGADRERRAGAARLPARGPQRLGPAARAARRRAPAGARPAADPRFLPGERLPLARGPDRAGGRGRPDAARRAGRHDRAALGHGDRPRRPRRDPGPRGRAGPALVRHRDHLARRGPRAAGRRLARGRAGRGLLPAARPRRRVRAAAPGPAPDGRCGRAAAAGAGRPRGAQDRAQRQVRPRDRAQARARAVARRRHDADLLRARRRQPRPRHGRAGAAELGLRDDPLRERVRQGSGPDRLRPGADRQGDRLRGRGRGGDAAALAGAQAPPPRGADAHRLRDAGAPARPGDRRHGGLRHPGRRGAGCASSRPSSASAWPSSRRRPTGWPATASTSARPSSWARCCSTAWAWAPPAPVRPGRGARPRPAPTRPGPTCSRSWRRRGTSCRASSSAGASSRS